VHEHYSNSVAENIYSQSKVCFILRPCQHDDGHIDDRSQIKVYTDERTSVHSARYSLTVTHSSSLLTEIDVAELQ